MNLGAQLGPMSITKLSPNWACQMGPIHCPKFLLSGPWYTHTQTHKHTRTHRPQATSRQIAVCKHISKVDIMVFHRCYKFSFYEFFGKGCYVCFPKIGLILPNLTEYFDCN